MHWHGCPEKSYETCTELTLPKAPLHTEVPPQEGGLQSQNWPQLFEQLGETRLDLQGCLALAATSPGPVTDLFNEAQWLRFWRCSLLSLLTEALPQNDAKRLAWLTTSVLRLPANHQIAVAEALFEQRWQNAVDPFAYVSVAARTIYRKHSDQRILGCTLKGYTRCTEHEASAVPDPCSLFHARRVEVLEDLHRAVRKLRMPDDVVKLLNGRLEGVSDSTVAADLGWTLQQMRTAQKRYERALNQLRLELGAYQLLGPPAEQWVDAYAAERLTGIPAGELKRILGPDKILTRPDATSSRYETFWVHRDEIAKWRELSRTASVTGWPMKVLLHAVKAGILPAVTVERPKPLYCVQLKDLEPIQTAYLTTSDAAAYLSLTEPRLLKTIGSGELPAINGGSQKRPSYFLRIEDLDVLRTQMCATTVSDEGGEVSGEKLNCSFGL